MMNWIIGGAAVLLLGPKLLRSLAENPEMLRRAADMTDQTRNRLVDVSKQGAQYVTNQINQRRMAQPMPVRPMQGTFGGLLRGGR